MPADECELDEEDQQQAETPLFEPLNFNYSAVESEVRFSFLENLDLNVVRLAEQFRFPRRGGGDLEEELLAPDMAVFKSQPNDIPLYHRRAVHSLASD